MSNEVLENIKSRRSVRTYTERQVSAGDLNLILEAAAYAPSGMNFQTWHFTAIQDAAIVALTSPQDCVEEMCALYQKRRDLVVDALRAIGVECEAPKATIYVWAKVPEGETSESFATKLLEEAHVVVTPGNGYGPEGEGYIRISLTTPDDRLLEAVDRIKQLV